MIIGAITLLRILFYRRGAKVSCTFFLSLSKRTGQARTPPDAPRCWAAAGALSLSLAAMPAAPTDLVVEADLLYEEDILRNAYSLKYWWRYMQAKHRAPARQRNLVAERALKFLPGCYKIWAAYLRDRHEQVAYRKPGDPALDALARTYERALVYMHKMPRLWLDYLSFLSAQPLPTETRAAFDRALKALPVTQHERIWEIYLAFAKKCPVTETAVRIYRRYLQFEPEGVEEYVEFLLGAGRVGEAALAIDAQSRHRILHGIAHFGDFADGDPADAATDVVADGSHDDLADGFQAAQITFGADHIATLALFHRAGRDGGVGGA